MSRFAAIGAAWKRAACAVLFLVGACVNAEAQPSYDRVAGGRYLSILGDCMGCHTALGGKPYAGGRALETPFGTLVAPNITPDATGIGNWSEEDFRRALKSGVSPGNKYLYPAMPYPAYARLSDADVAKLWAYFRTLEPVRNTMHVNRLMFPFNIRALMIGWNGLYFRPASFTPRADKTAAWNRGAWLVTGPGHCGTCHTPKTFLGADRDTVSLAGASLKGWFAPDVSANGDRGIGGWREDDIVAYLKSGHNSHSMASGPMAEVIENSTSKMTDADLHAIAIYLSDTHPQSGPTPVALASSDVRVKAGAVAYRDNCAACHGDGGKGEAPALFPPLAGNPIVRQASAETLARVVLAGTRAAQTDAAPTAPAMPSFGWKLGDADVADILTYIRNSWGNAAASVSADAVKGVRAKLKHHS